MYIPSNLSHTGTLDLAAETSRCHSLTILTVTGRAGNEAAALKIHHRNWYTSPVVVHPSRRPTHPSNNRWAKTWPSADWVLAENLRD